MKRETDLEMAEFFNPEETFFNLDGNFFSCRPLILYFPMFLVNPSRICEFFKNEVVEV